MERVNSSLPRHAAAVDARAARATGNHLVAQNDEAEPAALRITPVSADVRIVSYGSGVCFQGRDDIVIEQQVGRAWVRVRTFNSLSNDYAHTQSRDEAHALARELLGTTA